MTDVLRHAVLVLTVKTHKMIGIHESPERRDVTEDEPCAAMSSPGRVAWTGIRDSSFTCMLSDIISQPSYSRSKPTVKEKAKMPQKNIHF